MIGRTDPSLIFNLVEGVSTPVIKAAALGR
jgi:hypothetical protein